MQNPLAIAQSIFRDAFPTAHMPEDEYTHERVIVFVKTITGRVGVTTTGFRASVSDSRKNRIHGVCDQHDLFETTETAEEAAQLVVATIKALVGKQV